MATQKEILIKVIDLISTKLIEAENILTELDSVGDADCGVGVRRGFEAVRGVMDEISRMELGDMLKKVGFTLAYTIGGTSGAMLGTGFIETGKSIGDNREPAPADWLKALDTALAVIKRRGGNTMVGDKTMVDALEPAIEKMKSFLPQSGTQDTGSAGKPWQQDSWQQDSWQKNNWMQDNLRQQDQGMQAAGQASNQGAAQAGSISMIQMVEAAYNAAKEGSDRTIDMVARKGRASYLGERSRGNRDPGSLIIVLMFEAALEVLRNS